MTAPSSGGGYMGERDDTIHANYPFLFEEEDQILPKQWELLTGT